MPTIGKHDGDSATDGLVSSEGADGEGDAGGWGVQEADARNKAKPSEFPRYCFLVDWGQLPAVTVTKPTRISGLATQLALAYAIHKSFIFIRVPLTAAVTPKVVQVLRSWGWQIGKRRSKQ